jgi:hypothetical protein
LELPVTLLEQFLSYLFCSLLSQSLKAALRSFALQRNFRQQPFLCTNRTGTCLSCDLVGNFTQFSFCEAFLNFAKLKRIGTGTGTRQFYSVIITCGVDKSLMKQFPEPLPVALLGSAILYFFKIF